ncbi:MAG TPA: FHA domain-containing protein [Xanthobacteraceae bacterium]|nr:FHA domain-containing protein [Xanthobacteraceae bacterium]
MEADAVTAPTAHPPPYPPPQAGEGREGAPFVAPARQWSARLKSARLKFEVVAGTHEGAVLMLDWADYRIGSSPNADIVLSDEGVAAEHAVLRLRPGGVRIDATGGDVTVEQERLPLWRGSRVRLPVNLTIGAARICLSGDGEDDPAPRLDGLGRWLIRNPLTAAGALACLVLAAAVITRELPQSARTAVLAATTGTSDVDALQHSRSGSAAAGRSIASAYTQSAVTAEQAAHELGARLDAAKIGTLHVSAADGRLAVAGKVSREEALRWAAIQQWFDQTYGGRIVLTTDISAAGEARTMPALQLQAIWYGEHPYIVTEDGERYFEGAVLDNGWIIREIGEDRLLLAKGGETVALTYR